MKRISPLMLAPPLIFVALAVLFYLGVSRGEDSSLPSALVGKQAPLAEVAPLGDLQHLQDQMLREGDVKLVNIWASWCAPCRAEHPSLMQLQALGIPVYGVNYKDKPDNALGFLQELGNPYTAVGADAEGRMALNWGVYGVPETYIIDSAGKILLRFAGPITNRTLHSKILPVIEAAQ